jgi:GNAT superfamily N-acetyltransferase
MTPQENVNAFIEAWRVLVHRYPNGQLIRADGIVSTFAHVPLPFLNVSFVERPIADDADLRGILRTLKERAKLCLHPSLAGVCDAWAPEGWEAIAAQEGFQLAMNARGMLARELKPPRRPLPDATWKHVEAPETARAIGEIHAEAYAMSFEPYACIGEPQYWSGVIHAYIGYEGDRAVTCAAALPAAGTIYVGFVATLPEARGKGLAETAMRKAIADVEKATGKLPLTLHASDAGAPLYRSMGFADGARVPILMLADG